MTATVLPLSRMSSAWREQLTALGVVAFGLMALFWADAAAMIDTWWNSSTYNHCLFVPPLIGWLVWQRRDELAQLVPTAWTPGLIAVAAGAGAWLVGYAGGIAFARQFGLVVMLQGAVVTMLGPIVGRACAFPIFYAFFAVPFGDEAVPLMQTVTAKLAEHMLIWSGVTAHVEGVFITTPAGYFEVAEACAGVKFLVAMVALGALIANVCFKSWGKRIAFMAASVIVPVLANGVRAWATIYIAEGSGVEFASSFDHVVYGFFFFAAVIAIIMGVAWKFIDRKLDDPWFDPKVLQPVAPVADSSRRMWRTAVIALAVAAAPLLWATVIAASGRQDVPQSFALPEVPGFTRIPAQTTRPWAPNFAGADRIDTAVYRDAAGNEVTLAVATFAYQDEARRLVGFGQGATGPDTDWAWTTNGAAVTGGRSELLASHGETREVVSFYRVGDSLTGSAMRVKLETMRVRLLGGRQRAVAVLVSAAAPAGGSARGAIDAFVRGLGRVETLADRAAGVE